MTTEISAEKSVTISKVIMLSRGLATACKNLQPTLTSDLSKSLITQLLTGLQRRFGTAESNSLCARATLLDPRFKKKGFTSDDCYRKVLGDITAMVASKIAASSAAAATSASQSTLTTDQTGELDDCFCHHCYVRLLV